MRRFTTHRNWLPLLAAAVLLATAAVAQAAGAGVRIDSGPRGATNDKTPTFTFSAKRADAAFVCAVDGSRFKPCTSPRTTRPLSDGPHKFKVREAGRRGSRQRPAIRKFFVDTKAPAIRNLNCISRQASVNCDWKTSDKRSRRPQATCAIDAEPAEACRSPFERELLEAGQHTFTVTVGDAAGNTATDSITFVVDDSLADESPEDGGPPED